MVIVLSNIVKLEETGLAEGAIMAEEKKIRKVGNFSVEVITVAQNASHHISKRDKQMDIRAREAVKSAIKKAKVCHAPIAKYDLQTKKAYIESADGVKTYVD